MTPARHGTRKKEGTGETNVHMWHEGLFLLDPPRTSVETIEGRIEEGEEREREREREG